MSEKEILYNELQDLRKQVKANEKAMKYYNYLKDLNLGTCIYCKTKEKDILYGWLFDDDAILKDTLEDLDLYEDSYIRDILKTYIGELETILYKIQVIKVIPD